MTDAPRSFTLQERNAAYTDAIGGQEARAVATIIFTSLQRFAHLTGASGGADVIEHFRARHAVAQAAWSEPAPKETT